MTSDELAFKPATELRNMIAGKQVSPVELTEMYFKRIEKFDGQLNNYLTLNRDEAMKQAHAAEQAVMKGEKLGPLHGLPISIKDLEITRGLRTTGGSLAYKDRIPDEDSVVAERIRNAGAVILGKTNTPEFGLIGRTENRLGDPCRNPWNPQRTTGGSSGGAGGSVIAGLCALAQGSDGGGSIRIPSSYCGIYGIKPTLGRTPRYSGRNAARLTNHFSQLGPMTRTVRDSAMLLQVLAGFDARDMNSLRETPQNYIAALDKPVKGMRIAWSPNYGYASVDPEVAQVCEKAAKTFESLGCIVEEVDFKLDSPFDSFWPIYCAMAFAAFGYLLTDHAEDLSDYGREYLEIGATVTGAEYARALGGMDHVRAQLTELLTKYDLLLSPTMAVPPFEHGKPPTTIAGKPADPFWGFLPFTYPINMAGNPAASIPAGFSREKLPIGLHIVGRRGDEASIFTASAAFEQANPWMHERPPIS
ncbi:MAG: amidase [Chloroflexi bacterium]|nr:amidase [Chloroflexota bacterium]